MKTRSNDIIADAPFKYNSDTNTLEVGTNLYVDGNTKLTYLEIINTDATTDGIFFNDTLHNVAHIGNDHTYFYFENVAEDGEFTEDYVTLEVLEGKGSQNILTDINTKTIFGNKSIYGSGNIDLYVHYLTIIANKHYYIGEMYSSNNFNATGEGEELTRLFNAPPQTTQNYITLFDYNRNVIGQLIWTGSIWQIITANDTFDDITSVTDRVDTI